MSEVKGTSFISATRIGVIAGHTFTQLVRMKVFYFLAIFGLLMLGLQLVEMPHEQSAGGGIDQNLRLLKSAGFFAMNTFAVVLALSATALLLPKDIEDRTLYTILCKPVPRLDYLIGKYCGVLLLIAVSLAVMDGLFCYILQNRVDSAIAELVSSPQGRKLPAELIEAKVEHLRTQGANAVLQLGVLAIFLKAAVVTAIALLISTFSTSTIFTIIVTIIVVLIGLIQADARDYFLQQQALGVSSPMSEVTRWIAMLFPDFQLLAMEDGVIEGRDIPLAVAGKVALVAVLYSGMYTVLAWFFFKNKEL